MRQMLHALREPIGAFVHLLSPLDHEGVSETARNISTRWSASPANDGYAPSEFTSGLAIGDPLISDGNRPDFIRWIRAVSILEWSLPPTICGSSYTLFESLSAPSR